MMTKLKFAILLMGPAILSGCGSSNVESIQQQVAESYFNNPKSVQFSDVFENSDKICGFASGAVANDRFDGPRPFWADADGGSMEIIAANYPEGFLINAARDCPTEFVNLLHDFPVSELRASRKGGSSKEESQ